MTKKRSRADNGHAWGDEHLSDRAVQGTIE
jgi:hypothetical protein